MPVACVSPVQSQTCSRKCLHYIQRCWASAFRRAGPGTAMQSPGNMLVPWPSLARAGAWGGWEEGRWGGRMGWRRTGWPKEKDGACIWSLGQILNQVRPGELNLDIRICTSNFAGEFDWHSRILERSPYLNWSFVTIGDPLYTPGFMPSSNQGPNSSSY